LEWEVKIFRLSQNIFGGVSSFFVGCKNKNMTAEEIKQ
jgi:hypothetical protein